MEINVLDVSHVLLLFVPGEQITLDVDLIETEKFPNAIRFRGMVKERIEQFKDPDFFKKGQIKAGYLIVVDTTAARLGYPVQDLDDLVARISQGERFDALYPAAGWHTTTAAKYHKRRLGEDYYGRAWDHIWLARDLSEAEAIAIGSSQNFEEETNEQQVNDS